jgi:agmatinase
MADIATDNAFRGPLKEGALERPTFSGALSFMRGGAIAGISRVSTQVVWGVPFDAATSNRPGARFRTAGHPPRLGDFRRRSAIPFRP